MAGRIGINAGLLIGIASLFGGAQAARAVPVTETLYACDGGQRLIVRRSGASASVQFVDRTYELKRKPSSNFEKYGSAGAALVIDGESAVFVATDRLQLGQCIEASRTASAR